MRIALRHTRWVPKILPFCLMFFGWRLQGQTADIVPLRAGTVGVHAQSIKPTQVWVNSPLDVMKSLEHAERILRVDPYNRAAQVERAVALAEFGLNARTTDYWRSLGADLFFARLFTRANPDLAVLMLDSLVTSYAVDKSPLRLASALALRCEARQALAKIIGGLDESDSSATVLQKRTLAQLMIRASADLDSSAAVLRRLSPGERHVSLLDAIDNSAQDLVLWHVNTEDPVTALLHWERGRSAFPTATGKGEAFRLPAIPDGDVAVEYILIGDTLLTWVVRSTGIRFIRTPVSRDRLINSITALRSSLESQSSRYPVPRTSMRLFDHLFVSTRKHQEELYEILIRPVESQLRRMSSITIIADGDLEGIPFAALYDNARQRFLVQDHTLRFARSLREAFEPMSRAEVPRKSVVLVSDPAFVGFPRLPGARAEVDTIAAEYIGATLLRGESADPGSVAAVLLRTEVLHYAGHAVHDPERPERSFLALAGPRGRRGSDRLTAAELETLDLRHLRLVVLAACETSRSKKGWSAGLPGLADAFLNAGAAGVVGSLSRVDDDHTRRLMIRFHRAYGRSRDGPAALRSAQLQLLQSDDPTIRSPAAWAGFQYMGR
jgi:hypothetical protein